MNDSTPKSPWLEDLGEPCDPEIFRRALDVWQTGSQFKLRKKAPLKKGLYLTDIPINRSAMATIGFLTARGVKNTQGYLWRAMHFGELLDHLQPGGRLAKFMKPAKEEGVMLISEALLHAVAVASVKSPSAPHTDNCVFDVEEIARLAEEAWEADSEDTDGE